MRPMATAKSRKGARDRLASIVMPVSYAVVGPRDENINRIYDLDERQKRVSALVYLLLEMLAYVGAPLKQALVVSQAV